MNMLLGRNRVIRLDEVIGAGPKSAGLGSSSEEEMRTQDKGYGETGVMLPLPRNNEGSRKLEEARKAPPWRCQRVPGP